MFNFLQIQKFTYHSLVVVQNCFVSCMISSSRVHFLEFWPIFAERTGATGSGLWVHFQLCLKVFFVGFFFSIRLRTETLILLSLSNLTSNLAVCFGWLSVLKTQLWLSFLFPADTLICCFSISGFSSCTNPSFSKITPRHVAASLLSNHRICPH